MQFRKVCNHPDLFERKVIRCPVHFHNHYLYPHHYYYSTADGMRVVFGHYQSNPLDIDWPVLLENYENEFKSPNKYQYMIYDILWDLKIKLRISQS